MDKDFEWGYREAVVGDIGSQIEVGSDESGWVSLECLGVFPADIIHHRFVCRSIHNPKVPVYYGRSRVRYRLPYAERQSKCGIGVGDYVKLLRVPEHREDGWDSYSVTSIAASVGKVLEVDKVHGKSGFRLKDGHWYPYFVLEKVEKPALPKGRTVADLADGEVICTDDGEWIQVIPRVGRDTPCDRQSSLGNPHNEGWVDLGTCGPNSLPARLLHAPTIASHGKEAFHVSNPNERFVIKLIFSDGDLRVVVLNANGYRVFMLDDLRVIPE